MRVQARFGSSRFRAEASRDGSGERPAESGGFPLWPRGRGGSDWADCSAGVARRQRPTRVAGINAKEATRANTCRVVERAWRRTPAEAVARREGFGHLGHLGHREASRGQARWQRAWGAAGAAGGQRERR
ncbi:hypothetical protein KM043_000279 [Ampulex compressa]|nr:hypothetical protein KM043_000279 [Ampulex compressa]